GNAVEKSVDQEPAERRVGHTRIQELVRVRFLAEMEVRRPGVLEEMDDEIAHQDQERRSEGRETQALGNHFGERGGQHETRAQGDKVGEEGAAPRARGDDHAAQNVGEARYDSQREADREGGHALELSAVSAQRPAYE